MTKVVVVLSGFARSGKSTLIAELCKNKSIRSFSTSRRLTSQAVSSLQMLDLPQYLRGVSLASWLRLFTEKDESTRLYKDFVGFVGLTPREYKIHVAENFLTQIPNGRKKFIVMPEASNLAGWFDAFPKPGFAIYECFNSDEYTLMRESLGELMSQEILLYVPIQLYSSDDVEGCDDRHFTHDRSYVFNPKTGDVGALAAKFLEEVQNNVSRLGATLHIQSSPSRQKPRRKVLTPPSGSRKLLLTQ